MPRTREDIGDLDPLNGRYARLSELHVARLMRAGLSGVEWRCDDGWLTAHRHQSAASRVLKLGAVLWSCRMSSIEDWTDVPCLHTYLGNWRERKKEKSCREDEESK